MTRQYVARTFIKATLLSLGYILAGIHAIAFSIIIDLPLAPKSIRISIPVPQVAHGVFPRETDHDILTDWTRSTYIDTQCLNNVAGRQLKHYIVCNEIPGYVTDYILESLPEAINHSDPFRHLLSTLKIPIDMVQSRYILVRFDQHEEAVADRQQPDIFLSNFQTKLCSMNLFHLKFPKFRQLYFLHKL